MVDQNRLAKFDISGTDPKPKVMTGSARAFTRMDLTRGFAAPLSVPPLALPAKKD